MAIFRKSYDYYIGYALGGGGAKGFAHLGALQSLEKKGLKPEIIVGTSAGALAGVFYADGFTPEEIAELFDKKEFNEFAGLTLPKEGFFKTTGLLSFLKKNLRANSFEQLRIPFIAVATDWEKARTVAFSQGDKLAESVIASCSIPVVFYPQYIDEVPYVDGGLLKNFPVSIIRERCRYVVGVNVTPMVEPADKLTVKGIAERTFKLMSNCNTIRDSSLCDILIEAQGLDKYSMFDLSNIDNIRRIGYESTDQALAEDDSLRIIHRCCRHYALQEKVKDKINRFKK